MYDLAAMYRFFIDNNRGGDIVYKFKKILDTGHTFEEIKSRILYVYYHDIRDFPWGMIREPVRDRMNENLLKQDDVYYHKNLLILNKVGVVSHDIDKGTLTNEPTEFFIEPRASYTMNEMLPYCYNALKIDNDQFETSRGAGLLFHYVKQLGLDLTLFTIEAMAIRSKELQEKIDFNRLCDHIPIGKKYMEEIKNNRSKEKYVLRHRRL